MSKPHIILLVVALAVGSAVTCRAEWVKIGEQDNKTYLVDTESTVQLPASKRKATVKTLFSGNPTVKEKKAEEVYDCAGRTITTGFVEVTLPTGKVITQMMEKTERPKPGSMEERKMRFICDDVPPGSAGSGK